MVFFCSNKVYGAFDSESLSSFQNAVGAFPFSIYPNSLGALSDPTILLINRSPFGAGSINRKFGLRSLMESLFVVGGISGTWVLVLVCPGLEIQAIRKHRFQF